MVKKPVLFLLHIKDATELIAEYLGNYTFDQFKTDHKTQDAVIRQLEIIGEATTNLENNFKADHPEIPWTAISDFRNVLAHEYWDIDAEIVWKAVTSEAPELKKALLSILEALESSN